MRFRVCLAWLCAASCYGSLPLTDSFITTSSSRSSATKMPMTATSTATTTTTTSTATTTANAFPIEDLIPKKETNVDKFLKEHPEYNGKGVIIGILDTGVDPGAAGLWTNPDGTSKLIGVVDCTGSGDVDVSTERDAVLEDDGWKVKGLTGRMITLPKDWKLSPFPKSEKEEAKKEEKGKEKEGEGKKEEKDDGKVKQKVRLGWKRAYELFPGGLERRVKKHRKEELEKALGPKVAALRQELSEWNAKHAGNKPTPADVRVKDDLEARLAVLQQDEEDPGPIYDCVVFWDGTRYRAAVDVDENGKPPLALAEFKAERQFGRFSAIDQYNYAVNFYDEGRVLSIVGDAGAHATHVAGIAASSYNDESIASGVAPGAQVVSFKIGDSRLGSMETGTGLVRAFIEAVKYKCDVINLSYGEGVLVPNTGRVIELAHDLVFHHNIIFVSSAGNNGPAISTVGAPGGMSTACLGISAYVSPAMMKADYSMMEKPIDGVAKEPQIGTTYTWSSVGPTPDGDNGVALTAPGGAITSVPNWTLQKKQLMNGTSMSSPLATGCIALLLSACKALGICITPSRIRKALENTAMKMDNLSTLQQGWGMIQVDKAFEYLVAQKDSETEDLYFDVRVDNRSGRPRGVYLRQPHEASVKQTLSVSVKPNFRKYDVDDETQKKKIDLELRFRLEGTESWVTTPDVFEVMHSGRSFKIEVDPTGLKPGVHTAKVLAYDTSRPDAGVMFSLPITVVKTLPPAQSISLGELDFQPNEVKRFFVDVPKGATWMDVTIQDDREDKTDSAPRTVVLHTIQLPDHAAYRDNEVEKFYSLMPSATKVASVPVHEGVTTEVTLARHWSTQGGTRVKASVQFHGVRPDPYVVQILPGGGGMSRIYSDLKNQLVNPSAKLTTHKTPLRPKAEGVITPLPDDRDVLPYNNKRIYQLLLSYEFNQEETGSFTPRAPALQGVLYDSAYESQMMMVFDSEKKYLGVADAYPSDVKAPKGNVTIRVQVRHDSPDMLEKLTNMTIWIERKLDKDIALKVFSSKEAMQIGRTTFKRRILRQGIGTSVFFEEPGKLPSSCKPGDVLTGTVSYAANDAALPGEGKRPGGFEISYLVGPKPPTKASTEATTPEVPDERTVEEKISEAVRDLKVAQLGKLTNKEKEDGKFEELYGTLKEEYPDHLPLLVAMLKRLDEDDKKRKDQLARIIEAANDIVGAISKDELALHYGKNHDKEDPKAVKERKEMDEKKSTLIDALGRKARAQADSDDGEGFDGTLRDMMEWIDIDTNQKYAILVLERESRAKRHGLVLKTLNDLLKKDGEGTKGGICPLSNKDLLERRAKLLEELGYTELVEYDKKRRVMESPDLFALF